MKNDHTQLLKPAQYAEHKLLTAILGGEHPPGSVLPGERELARDLGLTRPTLRETLHRLAAEGWITIHHGKATLVNDYWRQGGLGLLSTMARYGQYLPRNFITHLLELRVVLIPAVAAMACAKNPEALARHLEGAKDLEDESQAFTRFDWELQALMAEITGNVTFPMILNDFGPLFRSLATAYFAMEKGREASRGYYERLARALKKGPAAVEKEARAAMQESITIWKELSAQEGG